MTEREPIVLYDLVLVTCVVERDRGDRVVHAVCEAGAVGATVCYGSGAGVRERLGAFGLALDVEREIIYVLIRPDQVDEVFAAATAAAELDQPGRGLVFATPVERCASFSGLNAKRDDREEKG